MELSNPDKFDPNDELQRMVKTMGSVTLPSDFWDDLKAEVGNNVLDENHRLLHKLTRFQHYADFKRTSKMIRSYKFENPMISLDVHDQGSDAFTCWAYSSATMIGNSCRVMVTKVKDEELIDEKWYNKCIDLINDSDFHTATRNSIMMILMPRQLHVDDESQAAFLRAAISRLANPTIIDREGVFYLEKVTRLIGYKGLKSDDFSVNYKTYFNNYHPQFEAGSKPLIDEAVKKQLCLVAAVNVSTIPDGPSGHGTHAMVLDTIKNGNFIFKNTYVKNQQVTIPVEKGPLEFYFLHLEVNRDGLKRLEQWTRLVTRGVNVAP